MQNNDLKTSGIPLWLQMAALMSLISLLLSLGLGIFVNFKAHQTVTGEYQEQTSNLTSVISELLIDDVIVGNRASLLEKIRQIGKIHSDLVSIQITDQHGEQLINWRSDESVRNSFKTEKKLTVAGADFGHITSSWNLQQTNTEISRRWKTVVMIVLGFFVVLSINILVMMKKTLFSPLKKIEHRLASFSDRQQQEFLPRTQWTSREFNNIENVADLLEQEIKTRKEVEEKLKQATQRANEANAAKSLFLANMSHELRTPLNAILGYSELLQELAEEKGDMQSSKDLQKIYKSGQHLLHLVNGVLDLSKVEAGKIVLNPSKADTCNIASEILESLQTMLKASNNQISMEAEVAVQAYFLDTLRFRQILFNLLSNAAKFTHNGKIRLKISLGNAADKGFVLYQVSDTGIGIASDKLEKIFNDFVQANGSISQHYGGTGLGLTISKKLSRLMGGDISVKSELGVGSTFTLRLPYAIDAESEKIPA